MRLMTLGGAHLLSTKLEEFLFLKSNENIFNVRVGVGKLIDDAYVPH